MWNYLLSFWRSNNAYLVAYCQSYTGWLVWMACKRVLQSGRPLFLSSISQGTSYSSGWFLCYTPLSISPNEAHSIPWVYMPAQSSCAGFYCLSFPLWIMFSAILTPWQSKPKDIASIYNLIFPILSFIVSLYTHRVFNTQIPISLQKCILDWL